MREDSYRKKRGGAKGGVLLLALLLLGGVLVLRALQPGDAAAQPTPEMTLSPTAAAAAETVVSTAAATPAPTPELTPAPTPPPEAAAAETEPVKPRPPLWRSMRYSDQSYFLVTDMVYAYRHDQSAAMGTIRGRLEELKAVDEELWAVWDNIMEYWDYINTAQEISYGQLPEDLPRDDSLCLVVLGFQLEPDGSMDPELIGRCEVALRCAEQYPRSYVLVTGGGTARTDRSVTEAGAMADWLIEHGVAPERILVEDRSMTTAENALYCDAILYEGYPQVRTLAIVTSDYHVGMGSLLFNAIAQRRGYESGEIPYTVAANAAFAAPEDREGTEDPVKQATFLWSLMDPKK